MTYQLTTIISPELDEKELEEANKKVAELVKNRGGKVLESEDQGRKKFVYPIKKQEFGHFLTFSLDLPQGEEAQKFFQKDIKKVPGIIRFLILKPRPVRVYEKPKAKKEKPEKVAEVKTEPKQIKITSVKIKPAPKIDKTEVKKVAKPKKSKIVTEIESEEDRMKTLDKKLDEILKE
jgi:small subunit ribosomal protein S6